MAGFLSKVYIFLLKKTLDIIFNILYSILSFSVLKREEYLMERYRKKLMLAIATISPTPNMELPPQYNGFVSENARLPRDIDDTELKKRMEKYQMEEIDNAEYELPEEYWEFVFLYAKLPKPL